MLQKNEKKEPRVSTVTKEKAERARKKAASAGTNQDSVAAELKNREHGSEQPAR
jgi:hypothetical protein